jgi:hypothetical protein
MAGGQFLRCVEAIPSKVRETVFQSRCALEGLGSFYKKIRTENRPEKPDKSG